MDVKQKKKKLLPEYQQIDYISPFLLLIVFLSIVLHIIFSVTCHHYEFVTILYC